MPIWLRTFTFNKVKEYYDEQQAEQSQTLTPSKKDKFRPDIQPSYSTKASR